jgi:putative transposase
VYARFRRWRGSGTPRRAHDALRARVRVAEGRAADASAAVIDSQSAKTTGVGGPARGYDGGKRVKGRKRHLLVDTTGLVLLAAVHTAALHDRDGARLLVETTPREALPRMQLVWADQGYTGAFGRWFDEARGWHRQVVRHPER